MAPDQKNQTEHGVLALLAGLNLLALLLRLWPVLFLLMAALFGFGLWSLIHRRKQAEMPLQASAVPPPQSAPISERELLAMAFGLLQRRITEQISAVYPHAKWVWDEPGARERFAAGGPLTILLNDAGGYRKAAVQVSDLQFYGLFYLPQRDATNPVETPPEQPEMDPTAGSMDYGLLAFEWVEANLQRVYAQNNETLADGRTSFLLPADELPHGDSWQAVCKELTRNGFANAEPVANGIRIQIIPQREENE